MIEVSEKSRLLRVEVDREVVVLPTDSVITSNLGSSQYLDSVEKVLNFQIKTNNFLDIRNN